MRIRRLGIGLGLTAAMLLAPTARAGTTIATITIDAVFGGIETFTTTGGLLCPSGVAITDPVFVAGGGSKGAGTFTFHLVKTLTCDDDSGTFKLLVDASASTTSGGTVGGFAAGQGTGAYAGLRGGGSLRGTGFPDGTGITDVYTGRLTIAP